MADLTIFPPQPLITLSFPSSPDVSARLSDRAGRIQNQNPPASYSSPPVSDGEQRNSSLLSPPLPSYRKPRQVRRAQSTETLRLPGNENSYQSEEEDSVEIDASEDELDPQQYQGPSYTRSFRPFSYPSTPRITEVTSHFQGDLPRPAPPLFRPKTFWRNTRRSALTGPSYSPSSYLVRRSTFIAAGLSFDRPQADLSALGVELRIGSISLVPSTALPL